MADGDMLFCFRCGEVVEFLTIGGDVFVCVACRAVRDMSGEGLYECD